MKLTEYELLKKQYKFYSPEQLTEIIESNDFSDTAKKVAQEILNSDRTEYQELIEAKKQDEDIREAKEKQKENNPLYEDVHQIANDLRFFKTLTIVLLLVSAFSFVLNLISMIKS